METGKKEKKNVGDEEKSLVDDQFKSVDAYISEARNHMQNQSRKVSTYGSSGDLQVVTSSADTKLDARKDELIHPLSIKGALPQTEMGVIAQWKARKLASAKQLEAAAIIYNAEIRKLEVQAEASIRESRNFWDAKSAEICETLRTYVQASLAALENERMVQKIDILRQASEHADQKLKEITSSSISEHIKTQLVNNVLQVMDRTISNILTNALAEKYDLGSE